MEKKATLGIVLALGALTCIGMIFPIVFYYLGKPQVTRTIERVLNEVAEELSRAKFQGRQIRRLEQIERDGTVEKAGLVRDLINEARPLCG